MTDVCLIFQVHQPYRLKEYGFELIGKDHSYEDSARNISVLNRIADLCYIPTNKILLDAIEKHKGKFRIAFSISGTCLEQFYRYRPDVIESFRKLSQTGCVEFLAETYYHSLACLYSEAEFRRQVVKHERAIQNLLEVRPTVFRNTELIYSDKLLPVISELGYKTILTEGKSQNMGGLSPNRVFSTGLENINILTRNFGFSDDIAFRFADPSWNEFPLNGKKFANWLSKREQDEHSLVLYMDYETFGEHRKQETGILDFLGALPDEIVKHENLQFSLPSDAAKNGPENKPVYSSKDWTSWADEDKDLGAWHYDHMQKDALKNLYACELSLYKIGRPDLLDTWGRLQTSDHFYYMSTRFWQDPVHRIFNPYNSPYDAYLNFMNALSDFKGLIMKA